MYKNVLSAVMALLFVLPGFASATVVDVEIGLQLPPSGTAYYDLDGDSITDIGLAEDCCRDETLWINGIGLTTDFQWAFVFVGDMIDDTLAWVSGAAGYTTTLLVGTSYVAVRNTSSGAYYGYMTIDFDGVDTFLTRYTYEDTGGFITVGSASAPEAASLVMLAFGLLGLGFAARRKA